MKRKQIFFPSPLAENIRNCRIWRCFASEQWNQCIFCWEVQWVCIVLGSDVANCDPSEPMPQDLPWFLFCRWKVPLLIHQRCLIPWIQLVWNELPTIPGNWRPTDPTERTKTNAVVNTLWFGIFCHSIQLIRNYFLMSGLPNWYDYSLWSKSRSQSAYFIFIFAFSLNQQILYIASCWF